MAQMAQMDRFFLGQSAQKEPVPMGKKEQSLLPK